MRRLFLAVAALLPCCVMAQVPKERVCNAAGLCAEVTTGAPAADSPALNVRSVGGGGGGTSSSFGAAFPADGTAAGAKVVSSPPTYSAGNMEAPTLDTGGNLRVTSGNAMDLTAGFVTSVEPSGYGTFTVPTPATKSTFSLNAPYIRGVWLGWGPSPSQGSLTLYDGINLDSVTSWTPARCWEATGTAWVRVNSWSDTAQHRVYCHMSGNVMAMDRSGGSGNLTVHYLTSYNRDPPAQFSVLRDSSGNNVAVTNTTPGGSEYGLVVRPVGGGGTSSNFGSTFPSSGTAAGFTDGTNMVAGKVMTTTPGASEPGLVVRPVGGSGSAPGGVEAGGSGTLNGNGQTVECYTGDTTGVYEGCFFRLTNSSLVGGIYFEGTVNGSTWEGFDCFQASLGPGSAAPTFEKTNQFSPSYLDGVYYCQDSPSGGVFHGYQGVRVRMANYTSGSVAVVSSRSKRVETKPTGMSYQVGGADLGNTNSYTGVVTTGDVTQKVREMPHTYYDTQYFNGNPATGNLFFYGTARHSPLKSISVTFWNASGSGFDVKFLAGCSAGLSCVGGYRPVACWRVDSSSGTPLWSEGYVTGTTGNPYLKSFTCPWFYGDAPLIVQNNSGFTVSPMYVTAIGHRESGMNIGMSSLMDASTGALASISGGALSVSGSVSVSSGTVSVQGQEAHSNAWSSTYQVPIAFYAEAEAAALDASNVADGDSTRAKADIEGRILVRTDHPYTWSCTRDAQTASGVCQASATAGYFITDVLLSNGATAQSVKVVYGTGSTCGTGQTVIIPTTYLPVNGGAVLPLRTPFRIPSTVDICCIISGSTAHSCRVSGHRGQ